MDEENGIVNDRIELAKKLSEMGKGAPKVSFRISYTGTPGNLHIDKSFQEFCSYYSNNEYLAGIALLLEVFYHYKQLSDVHGRIDEIEARLEEDSKKSSDKPKTF